MKKIGLSVLFFVMINIIRAQIITTVAGNGSGGYSGDGGQSTAAELYYPQYALFDPLGNMYIADTDNNVIRKVSTSGIITTIVGTGTQGYSGDGGPAINAEINYPRGLVFDGVGNLYVTEAFGNRIRKVAPSGIISTFAGTSTGGYSGDGGQASAAELFTPYVSLFDAAGNLYIADYDNSRIRKINTLGIISTFAGTGIAGNSGDGGQATEAELTHPTGIVFDAIGNVYFTDNSNSTIRKVNTLGIITTYAGTGIGGFSGDCGSATAAELYHPFGIVMGAEGNLYITDSWNNRVRKVNTSGIITTIAGNGFGGGGTGGYSGDGGPALAAELFWPSGITFDAANNIYIADQFNHRIRKITNAGGTLTATSSTICAGSTTTLTASGSSSYTWSTGATTASVVLSPTVTTNYTVTGVTGTCPSQTVTTINVASVSPTVTISGSNTICIGGTTTLTASGATTYTWSTGATTNSIVVNPTSTNSYTVMGGVGTCTSQAVTTINVVPPTSTINISGSVTVCAGENITLSASGANTYTWNTGATIAVITEHPTTNTNYTVVGSIGTCTIQTVTTITVIPAPITTITGNTVICSGQSTTLTVGGANTYTWSTGENTPSITISPTTNNSVYGVTGTVGTCTNQSIATVSVNPIPIVFVTGNILVCVGTATSLLASGANTYSWSTGATTANVAYSPTTTTIYTVTGAIGSCTAQAGVTVNVISSLTLSITGNTVICAGYKDTLTASGANTYIWSTGATTSSIIINPTKNTTYTVSSSVGTCEGKATETVYVNPSPIAVYTVNPNPATTINPQVVFTNLSVNYTNWCWNFGDGSALDSIDLNPSHYYNTETGNSYQTSLTLTNNKDGCTDVTTIELVINPVFTFYIPNTFTPNGDGLNDVFKGEGMGIASFTISVFDRWGACIFHSNDITSGWNGTVNGRGSSIVQEGIYVWQADIKDVMETSHTYHGTVSLIK